MASNEFDTRSSWPILFRVTDLLNRVSNKLAIIHFEVIKAVAIISIGLIGWIFKLIMLHHPQGRTLGNFVRGDVRLLKMDDDPIVEVFKDHDAVSLIGSHIQLLHIQILQLEGD